MVKVTYTNKGNWVDVTKLSLTINLIVATVSTTGNEKTQQKAQSCHTYNAISTIMMIISYYLSMLYWVYVPTDEIQVEVFPVSQIRK